MICFRYNSVDINVAVATDAGLITPIVFRADVKVNMNPVARKYAGGKQGYQHMHKPDFRPWAKRSVWVIARLFGCISNLNLCL